MVSTRHGDDGGDDTSDGDGGDGDDTSDGGGGDGGDTSDGGGGDGGGGDRTHLALVSRSGLARPPPWRALRPPLQRPSAERPHSGLAGAAPHKTGRSRLQSRSAPAPPP